MPAGKTIITIQILLIAARCGALAAASIATARIAALPAMTARHRRRRIHRAQATRAQAASPSEDDVDGTRSKMPIEDTTPTVMPSRRAALLSAAAASSIILPGTPSLAIPSYNVTLAKLDKEARDKASSITVVTPEEQIGRASCRERV